MNEWLLAPPKIQEIYMQGDYYPEFAEKVAKAQAKKLVEMLESKFAERNLEDLLIRLAKVEFRILLEEDWQALCKEVGLGIKETPNNPVGYVDLI